MVRVLDLVKRNEYKRRQAPPGVRVSRRAFGRDWRYPDHQRLPPMMKRGQIYLSTNAARQYWRIDEK